MWGCDFHDDPTGATELAEEHNDDTHTQVADGGCAAAAAAPYYGSYYQPFGGVPGSAAGGLGTQSHPSEPQSGCDPAADGYASGDAECFGGSQPLGHVSPPDDPLDGLHLLFGDDDHPAHATAGPFMQQQTPRYPHPHYGFPPYQIPQLAPTAGDAPNLSTERAPEVTIGERLQLVDDFDRRLLSGERISMAKFAKEKGLTRDQFKQWYYAIKRQREEGKQIIDPNKKRNRQPQYRQIEDEMRQWMAEQPDPMSVPPKDIREKAMEIKIRLGVRGFSASDSWVKGFRNRYRQDPPTPAEPPAAAAAAAAGDDTDGMTLMSDEEFETAGQELLEALHGAVDDSAEEEALITRLQTQSPQDIGRLVWRLDGVYADQSLTDAVRLLAARVSGHLRQPSSTNVLPSLSISFPAHGPPPPVAASASAAAGPPPAMHPLHPHFHPIPLTDQSEPRSHAVAAAAAAFSTQLAHLSPLQGQTSEAAAAASDQPADGTPSERQTMSVVPSTSRQTNERGPPTKIRRDENRKHREGAPSAVLSRSSVKSGVSNTVDDRLSDILEDDNVITVADDVDGDVVTAPQDTPLGYIIVGSSLNATQCAALRSLFVPSLFEECDFKLLYRASRDGPLYNDFLRCVGDANGLVFVMKKSQYVFGACISQSIRLPTDAAAVSEYGCDGWHFSLSGHFEGAKTMMKCGQSVWVAGRQGAVYGLSKVRIWFLCMGAGADMRKCCQFIPCDHVPEGYVGVRDERGDALFGGSRHFMADEVEVIRAGPLSVVSPKLVDDTILDPIQCAALYGFLDLATGDSLRVIYRAARDGPSYGDLLHRVGDSKRLVLVVKKEHYVFGAYMSDAIKPPDDPRAFNHYECDVWEFSLAGHFDQPSRWPVEMAMGEGRQSVGVAGWRSPHWPKLCIGWGMRIGTFDRKGIYFDRKGNYLSSSDDVRSCSHAIVSRRIPEGYVGVRDERGDALLGGSEHFMADDVEVLLVSPRATVKKERPGLSLLSALFGGGETFTSGYVSSSWGVTGT
ncbi:unnamed protein product [Vitrella brassicaformis CCMP3155]|uniref:Oxidation resistance protein 1 n=1 Tax=Vitrella brassicaformis (strain CCMP3155) TaxID=1169540 RepID=A0A0G4EMB1_VITBC|nr:unnamed protein product [Vitrella brassicaformis CCMP3155]|eukprot:CEL98008.1 unnamed protein product [Vitrella brassicaformis CCMP3155]